MFFVVLSNCQGHNFESFQNKKVIYKEDDKKKLYISKRTRRANTKYKKSKESPTRLEIQKSVDKT